MSAAIINLEVNKVSEQERQRAESLIQKISALPEPLQDRLLDQATGASMALDMIGKADKTKEKGAGQ